jgi:hypothetical protein
VKLGDLVTYNENTQKWAVGNNWVGMIIETGKYVGNRDVRVMWQDGSIAIDASRRLEVISESR